MKQTFRDREVCLGLVLVLSLGAPLLGQEASPTAHASTPQQSSSASSDAAKKQNTKPKKVWTNDTITETRTRADIYLDQKAASESAAKTDVAKLPSKPETSATQAVGAPPIVLSVPKTMEEAQQAIARSRGMLENFQNLLATTQEQLSTESDPTVRATLEQKAKLLSGDVNSTMSDLKTLEKALKDLQAGKKSENQ